MRTWASFLNSNWHTTTRDDVRETLEAVERFGQEALTKSGAPDPRLRGPSSDIPPRRSQSGAPDHGAVHGAGRSGQDRG